MRDSLFLAPWSLCPWRLGSLVSVRSRAGARVLARVPDQAESSRCRAAYSEEVVWHPWARA